VRRRKSLKLVAGLLRFMMAISVIKRFLMPHDPLRRWPSGVKKCHGALVTGEGGMRRGRGEVQIKASEHS
jgi:hypothetical protein